MTLTSVHLTNYYHKQGGGISTAYNDLLAAAERHRRRVCLIVPGETTCVEDVNPFARIYYFSAMRAPFYDRRYRLIMPWQFMIKPSAIRDIMVAERPFMVEVADKYALSIFGAMIRKDYFLKLGRPMLVHLSCERMDDNLSNVGLGRWFGEHAADLLMRNYTLPSFDFHIANSDYTAAEFHEALVTAAGRSRLGLFSRTAWRFFRSPKIDIESRISVNFVGVDTDTFSSARRSTVARQNVTGRTGVTDNAKILFYAGRLSPEKNTDLLTDTLAELLRDGSDYRLLIAGGGPLENKMRIDAEKRFPGKLILLGHLDRETLADFYSNSDIFLHPNPREPYGLGPLEAMASGTPVVAPNSGGVLSYANDENAWLREPNGIAFASAVRQIFEDRNIRDSKIRSAIDTAFSQSRHASTDALFASYDKMYDHFQKHRELFSGEQGIERFDYAQAA